MKHRSFVLILALILVLTMTACSAANATQTLSAAADRAENKLDVLEDTVEMAIQPTAAPTPTAPAPAPTETNTPAAAASQPSDSPLSEEDARQIALDYVHFTADQVQHLRTEYEIDDGIAQYDVEFWEGDWEYEFEINAENGKILSFDKDNKYD